MSDRDELKPIYVRFAFGGFSALLNYDEQQAIAEGFVKYVPERAPIQPVATQEDAGKVPTCQHQFHYFGDQVKERRCVRCDVLESKTTTVPQVVQAPIDNAETITRLQKALSFWLPRVPAWENDVSQRIEQDAWLLCGLEPEYVAPCAQDLGIVTLIDPVAAPKVATTTNAGEAKQGEEL